MPHKSKKLTPHEAALVVARAHALLRCAAGWAEGSGLEADFHAGADALADVIRLLDTMELLRLRVEGAGGTVLEIGLDAEGWAVRGEGADELHRLLAPGAYA